MIVVKREPETHPTIKGLLERCCFCRKETPYWYTPEGQDASKAVACCRTCAQRAEPQDVPDKKTWCRRERIATGEAD